AMFVSSSWLLADTLDLELEDRDVGDRDAAREDARVPGEVVVVDQGLDRVASVARRELHGRLDALPDRGAARQPADELAPLELQDGGEARERLVVERLLAAVQLLEQIRAAF